MDKRYKVTLTSKNLYKEIDLAPSMSQLKVGTAPECDIRIRKDLFFESIEMTFVKSGDQWSVVCSDNLYFSEGDVRKLITKNLNHGDEFVVKYQNSDGDILSVSFMLDFDYAEKAYDVCGDIAPLHCIVIGGKDGSYKNIPRINRNSDYPNHISISAVHRYFCNVSVPSFYRSFF